MYEKAREVYKDYFDNVREDPYMQRLIAGTHANEGQYDLALQWMEKAAASNPTIASKAPIYQLMGDFEAAEKEYETWPEMGGELLYWQYMEILYRTMGQYKQAKKMAQAGLMYAEDNNLSDWKRTYSFALAAIDLATGYPDGAFERAQFIQKNAEEFDSPSGRMNAKWIKIQVCLLRDQIEKAEPLAEEMKANYDSTPDSRDVHHYLYMLGQIETGKQNYLKAIDLIKQAYDLLGGQRSWISNHAFILFNLAKAYELSGNIEGAKTIYENILSLTTGRFWWGNLYVKSYYELGKIHEQQGSRAQAIEHYEKFLDLWKNADPGLPEVDDAKTRLAGLTGSVSFLLTMW